MFRCCEGKVDATAADIPNVGQSFTNPSGIR